MERLIIDGYNVIHAVPAFSRQLDRSLEAARQALIAYCRSYQAARPQLHVTVVFDGTEASSALTLPPTRGVSVLFTDRREEADERILALLRGQPWSRVTVVSNDTYVFNNARAHGARMMPVTDFYRTDEPSRGRPAPRVSPAADKALLPARAAAAITEEYRRYLQRKRST